MKAGSYEQLKRRGFVSQCSDEQALRRLLDEEQVTFYIGFDPTASSLHAGSLVPIMALMHMQRAGHRPIVLVGGGTGLVGDPSMRTEMRKLLTLETIEENVAALKRQLSRFLDFSEGAALMLNSAVAAYRPRLIVRMSTVTNRAEGINPSPGSRRSTALGPTRVSQ